MINIPKQLQKEEFRFVLLGKWNQWKNSKTNEVKMFTKEEYNNIDKNIYKPLGKSPFEKNWQNIGYIYTDKKLIEHISKDNNFGVIGGYGNLRIIDIDDNELAKMFSTQLDTFTIKGLQGMHFYILCDYDINHVFKDNKGEFRANNYQVVGPSSIHPSGIEYKIVNNHEIKEISEEEILKLLNPILRTESFEDDTTQEQKDVDKEFIHKHILHKLNLDTADLITTAYTADQLKNIGFPSRSHRDQKIITTLLFFGFGQYIKSIFKLFPVGDKYREHGSKDSYLNHSIKKARLYSGVIDDYVVALVKNISFASVEILRNKIEEYLIKINKIDNWLTRNILLSDIAFKIKISKKDLLLRAEELKNNDEIKKPISVKDILSKKIPETQYWIENLIPKESRILIGGKPSSFKSNFVLYITLCMSQNISCMNEFKSTNTSKPPKILIYDLENGDIILHPRLKYMIKGLGITENSLDNIEIEHSFNKLNIKKEVEFAKAYDIIILDSYRRFLKGSENESEITDMFFSQFVNPLQEKGKTIIIIHHFKKSKVEDYEDESELMDLFRGSGDIPAQFDLMYGMFKKHEHISLDNKTITFDVSTLLVKNRMGLPIQNFNFRVTKDDINKLSSLQFINYGSLKSSKDKNKEIITNVIKIYGNITRHKLLEALKTEFNINLSAIRVDQYLRELLDEIIITQPAYGTYSFVKY